MQRPHAAVAAALMSLSLLATHRAQSQTPGLTLTASPQAIAEFRQAWAAAEINNAQPAITHLKAALGLDPSFGLARVMYVSQGGVSPAQQTAELNRGVADAARGSAGELVLAMAWRELAENRIPQAQALFRAATALVPADPFIALRATGIGITDPKAAYAAIQATAAKFPDYAPTYNSLAYSAWAAGDHAAAIAAAEKQVQMMHGNPNAHDSYAELLQWSGKLPEALHHYSEAAEMDPAFTEGLIGVAEVETHLGHFDKARAAVNQAVTRATVPGLKLQYMRDLAGISAISGDGKMQLADLQAVAAEAKAQGNTRIQAIALSQLAATYGALGDAKSAHSYADQALAASPGPLSAVSFFTAMAHAQMKHWDPANAAIAAGKAAPDAAANSARLAAAQAYIATAQGKSADAIALLSKADLTDALVAGRLAEAYAASGNSAEAMKLQLQISNDYTLGLGDWAGANAHRRANAYLAASAKKKK